MIKEIYKNKFKFLFIFATLILIVFPNSISAHTVIVDPVIDKPTHWVIYESPYIISGIFVLPQGVLDIDPGVVIKINKGGFILNQGGEININGTQNEKVTLTSIADDIVLGDTNNDGNTTDPNSFRNQGIITDKGGVTNLNHIILKYTGSQQAVNSNGLAFSSILNTGGRISAQDLSIIEAFNTGIYHYVGTTTIINSYISGTMNDAVIYNDGDLTINNSIFDGYIGAHSAINQSNTNSPDLTNNWWGDASGPYHVTDNPLGKSAEILGKINFIPFLKINPNQKNIDPVIAIPGIMGSAYKNGVLIIDPILHTYDDLLSTLESNGYKYDKTLFTFPYEWRDSNLINSKKLKNKIDEVKNICSCSKVDIVAHSMGGLLARSYIQSVEYQNDIDQLIFLGTPHRGSAKSYLQWEAGQNDTDIRSQIVSTFFFIESVKNGYTSVFEYIRNRPILSVQELLPIDNYIIDKETNLERIYPNNYPKNLFLENINLTGYKLINSGINIINIYGDSSSNFTISKIRVNNNSNNRIWEHGEPDGFYAAIGDHGLERGEGDNTVLLSSAKLEGVQNEEIVSSHNRLPTLSSNRIVEILTGNKSTVNIDNGFNINEKILLIQLLSPIDLELITPDGKRIGKDFNSGNEVNEIPNAFYSGFNNDNEYVTILNPIKGEYKLQVKGTGTGGEYKVVTASLNDNFATTTIKSGITENNQVTNFSIVLSSSDELQLQKDITLDVLINDIEKAYQLGWITDKNLKDKLIKKINKIIKKETIIENIKNKDIDDNKKHKKIEKIYYQINKIEADLLLIELRGYRKNKISEEAYNIIKQDLEYIIDN